MAIKIRVGFAPVITARICSIPSVRAELAGVTIKAASTPAYAGDCVITPAQTAQVLYTKDYRMPDHIVVAPIPSNYGLITYDGFAITVS